MVTVTSAAFELGDDKGGRADPANGVRIPIQVTRGNPPAQILIRVTGIKGGRGQ
jgi:hypothetical protein